MSTPTHITEEDIKRADAFIDMIRDSAPEVLSMDHIARACVGLILTYAEDHNDASVYLTEIISDLRLYYTGGECMCDECVAHRKATAN